MIMIKKIRSILSPLKFKRGNGFPGDGNQQLRTKQIEIISSLTKNKTFISHYPELLRCNEKHEGVADKIDVSKKIKAYFDHTNTWLNYKEQTDSLEVWSAEKHGLVWPNIHATHRHVVDICKELGVKKICDVGAGAGVVSKFLYAETRDTGAKITCLEGSTRHIAVMKENFNNSSVISPKIKVEAEIVKGIIQNAPFKDNTFDLAFTCTVIMHNAYIPAVLAISEITRISSKYVLYVEGYHTDGIPKIYKDKFDRLLVDYETLHQKLGYKTLRKEFYQDPFSKDYEYIVYLAEKITI